MEYSTKKSQSYDHKGVERPEERCITSRTPESQVERKEKIDIGEGSTKVPE